MRLHRNEAELNERHRRTGQVTPLGVPELRMDDLETVQGCSPDPMKSRMLDYQEVTTEITRLQGLRRCSNRIRSKVFPVPCQKMESRLLTAASSINVQRESSVRSKQ